MHILTYLLFKNIKKRQWPEMIPFLPGNTKNRQAMTMERMLVQVWSTEVIQNLKEN